MKRKYVITRTEITEYVTEVWADSHDHAVDLAQARDPEDTRWTADGFYLDYVALDSGEEDDE